MTKYIKVQIIMKSILFFLGFVFLIFVFSYSKRTPTNINLTNETLLTENNNPDISGSYVDLFKDNELIPDSGGSDLGRPLGQRVIWEHIAYGYQDGIHRITLNSFEPEKLKIMTHRELSSEELKKLCRCSDLGR